MTRRMHAAGRRRIVERIPILQFLADLESEVLEHIDEVNGTDGPVTVAQRSWSWVLDQIAAERETA